MLIRKTNSNIVSTKTSLGRISTDAAEKEIFLKVKVKELPEKKLE